jgi:hypothetical protein
VAVGAEAKGWVDSMRTRGMAKPRVDESRPRCRRVPSNPLEKQQLHAARRRGRQPGYHTGIGRTEHGSNVERANGDDGMCLALRPRWAGCFVALPFRFPVSDFFFLVIFFSWMGGGTEQSNFCRGFEKSGRPYEETGAIAHT